MAMTIKHKDIGGKLTKALWLAADTHEIDVPHDALSGVTSSQHHIRYSDTEAVAAAKGDADIADAIAKKHSNTLDHSNALDHAATEMVVVKVGDTGNATITLADAAGLSFPVLAGKTYIIEGFIVWDSSAITVGIKLSATGPVSPTRMAGHFIADAANGTPDSSSFNADNVVVTTSASPFTAGCLAALHCVLVNGANPGTFQIRFAAETTGTVTIKAGSCLRYRQVN